MLTAILRRLLLAVPTIVGVSMIVFAIIRLVPGDPALVILGLNATPSLVAQVNHELGLNEPVYVQYGKWAGGALHGNFGYDYQSGQPISGLLGQALPVTAELVALSLGIAIVLGILIGVAAARWRDRAPDWVAQTASLLGISVPDYWLGVILMLTLGLKFALFPTAGYVPLSQGLAANLSHLVLPALALSTSLAAVLIRMTRAAMLDVLDQDFVRFARASGVSAPRVVFSHALRNAAAPVVTVIGIQVGYLFGATVIIEKVFSLPGIGQLILNSTLDHDYPVIQASVLVLAVIFIFTNLLVDVAYICLDPRLRTGHG
jgi:peptide/nickel transport system permease protein